MRAKDKKNNEQKIHGETLIDLQVRHEALLEFSESIIGEIDPEGRFLYLSPSLERVLGFKPEDLLGENGFEHIHPEDREPVNELITKLFADGPGAQAQAFLRWPHAEGGYRQIDFHAICYQRSDGTIAMAYHSSDITAQKALMDQLRETESRFEATANLSDTMIAIVDEQGRYSYLNETCERVVGFSIEELLGTSGFDRVHSDDLASVQNTLTTILENPDEQVTLQYRYGTKSGEWALLETRFGSFVAANGVRMIIGNGRDVTEREYAAKRLRESEARLERALDTTGLGIWEWDIASNQLSVDAAYERLLGYEPGEMQFEEGWVERYLHPEDVTSSIAHVGNSLKIDAAPHDSTLRLKHKAGGWRWMAVRSAVTERDEAGRATRVLGTNKDIDAEVLAQQEAKHATRRVALLLKSTEEGICGIDDDGAITFMNPAAERMLGQPKGSLLGKDFTRHVMDGYITEKSDRSPVRETLRLGGRLKRVLARFRRADDSLFPVEFSISPITEDSELRGAVLVFRDETRTHRLADRLQHQAMHDAVTGLTNRQGFEDAVEQLLADARMNGSSHALFYLDLDQFRVINATSGHVAGDELLRQLAVRLDQELPDCHTLARIGGDEFGVLLENCSLDYAAQIAHRLRKEIADFSFIREDRVYRCGVCIGVVAIDAQSNNSAEVLASADAACFAAKEAGRNRIHVASASDPVISQRRDEMAWAARTREALDNNRLVLFSQPIVPINPSSPLSAHAEILVRMRGSKGEILEPGLFLPAAERHFLMPALDRWVLRKVLAELSKQSNQTLRYSVNLSGSTISEESLLDEITDLIDTSGVCPKRLCFEITETSAIANLPIALKLMEGLRQRGCEFSLDDFGTGMSSLTYLRQLPVDYVKIDGKFVRGILDDSVDQAIVQAVFDVTSKLGIRTVAEHVESKQMLARLSLIGIDYAQGFFTGRPAPLTDQRNTA